MIKEKEHCIGNINRLDFGLYHLISHTTKMFLHLQVAYNIPSLLSHAVYTEAMKYVRALCMIIKYDKLKVS